MQRLLMSMGQGLIDFFVATLNFLFSAFPPSPFKFLTGSPIGGFLSQINYFLPVYDFVVIIELWLVAVSVFYVYLVFARWLKAIE